MTTRTRDRLRVVLFTLNSQFVHSSLAPWCLKAGLRAFALVPCDARVLEATVNEAPQEVLGRLVETRADIIGISCYIWNIRAVKALLPSLRNALPRSTIVLGGPEISHRARQALEEYPEADFAIAGEGELPFARLVDALNGQGSLEDVPGLQCRGKVAAAPYTHMEIPPSPYDDEYFSQLQGRLAYIETSRGCPYSCAYCLSGGGERVQYYPLDRVAGEISALTQAGARTIKFVDRTFNAHRPRAAGILQDLAALGRAGLPEGLRFHFEIAGDLIDEALLEAVQEAPAGLFQFEIGLQSVHEDTLLAVRRRTDMALLQRNVQSLLAMRRAHVHLDLIAGLPYEDLSRFRAGFNRVYLLRPHALQLGFLKLIHGSAMRGEPEHFPLHYDSLAPYEVRSTPWMDESDFCELKTVERALDKVHNSGRFSLALEALTGEWDMEPYALFLALGRAIKSEEAKIGLSLPLSALYELAFRVFCDILPAKSDDIRALLLMDHLSSVRCSVLPAGLKQQGLPYHQVKRVLKERYPQPQGAHRGIVFLTGGAETLVAFCDYRQRQPVTGRFEVTTLPLSGLT